MSEETVIIIPSKRKPPILTLESYPAPPNFKVFIVADPEVFDAHSKFYFNIPNVDVVLGVMGQGANKALCYEVAYQEGFEYFFRMDDDLQPRTFVGKEKNSYPSLEEVISLHEECLIQTETTLAGASNGSNRYWMSDEHKRTYGLVHGGANLSVVCAQGAHYLDPRITRGEDVYRTCSHRLDADGYVGRVGGLGFDKRGSTIVQTSINATQEQINASTKLILQKFPDMVSCNGTRFILDGKYEIPNWRMLKP